MKKLMFAAAIAASAAAFADPINAISFENSQYETIANATNLTGKADIPDPGRESATGATGYYFLYQGDGSDSSFVTNKGATVTDKITGYYNGLENYSNEKFLALDTEGGTLWRSIGQLTGNNDALGTAQAVAETGTYLDTLVQFTVTEDEAPTVGADDKLAIWLQAGEGVTNLMVRAKAWSFEGELTSAATNFVIANSPVEPGVWYRLTVKAVQTIIDPASGYVIPAFQIYIDGTEVAATTPQISAELQAVFTQGEGTSIWLQGMADLAAANKLFPTLAENPQDVTAVTLQGVGFQGTGAVDEIVWTEDDPFPAATVEFTLTYTAGDANVTLGAVTYTVGEGEPTLVTFTENVAQIPENASVTISNATFTTGYQLAALTVGGVPVDSPSFPYSFTITSNTTVSITSEQIPAAYPTYVGENAALRTQYDAWRATNGADSESAYEKQFLLNVAPNTTVADDALVIESITENATAGWDIVVSTSVSGAALSDGSATTYNGYLLVKSADTLAGLATATPTAYTVTAVTGGKVSITVTSGKFMKAVLTTTAPAQN